MTTAKQLIAFLKTLPEDTRIFVLDSFVDKDFNTVPGFKDLCLDGSITLRSPSELYLVGKKD